ncbi:MAG: SPOR domain-containing protein [Rhodocyclaceae bacterium]|nr:SPOR domain-containing protein [Rhodocyclaceae bacterium]
MADDEKQIEIKKRARRRLVGAAALALLAVVVLPMVMDSEPRLPAQDIQVRIPPQTGSNSMASQIEPRLPVRPSAQPSSAPPGPAAKAPADVPESAGADAPQAAASAPVAPAPKPAAERGESGRATEAAGAPQPAVVDEAARAAAILAGGAADGVPPVRRFVVQVGAYRDRGNATNLQGKLKADGFSAFTERSGDKTRVRIGPFDDRADAESVLARVRRMGLGGSVLPLN